MFHSRRSLTALFLLAAAGTVTVVGQVGASPSPASSEQPVMLTSTTSAPATTTTIPPATTTTSALAVEPVTTTTLPPATATAAAPATTTTVAPVPATSTTTTAPRAADSIADPMAQVVSILDSSTMDWRSAGVSVQLAFHPDDCCHWGNYETATKTLWIGPTAFATPARLRYVVLHEVAHAWQVIGSKWTQLMNDMKPWGHSGAAALEYGADCVASLWGSTMSHYWSCPAAARALMQRRLAGDWA